MFITALLLAVLTWKLKQFNASTRGLPLKQIVILVVCAFLLSGVVFGQSLPSSASPFKTQGTTIYNPTPAVTSMWVVGSGGSYDTLGLYYFGGVKWFSPLDASTQFWYLGRPDNEWNKIYGDTVLMTSTAGRLGLDGDLFQRLDGEGLRSSGGLNAELQAVLGTDIVTGEVVDQTLTKEDIDTTTAFTFSNAYKVTGGVADSAFPTLNYVKTTIAGIPTSLAVGDTASFDDGYVLTWNKTASEINLQADDGAGSGDDIKYNVGAGDVDLSAAVFKGDITVDNDTITVNAGIRADADTVGSAGAIYDFTQSWLLDIDSLNADTIVAKQIFVDNDIYGRQIFLAGIVDDESDLYTGIDISVAANTPLTIIDGSTAKWRFERDSLVSDVVGGGIIKGSKWMESDSVTVGAVTLGGYVSGVLNPAMAARNVRDSLANYVLKTNENWQDYSGDASIQHLSGLNATDVLARMTRTLGGDDTTTITVPTGNLKLEAPMAVSIIGGPGNPTLDDTLNANGYNIYGISRAQGDTADFTTYVGLPTSESFNDSITAVRVNIRDTAQAMLTASYLTAAQTRTAISDSSAVHKWIPMDVVSSWVKPLSDSVYLLDNVVMDRAGATPEQYLVLDSAGDINVGGGSVLDTFFVVGTLPEMGVIDSFQFTYRVSGAGVNIDTVAFMGPTQADLGINQCDSVYYGDGTNRTSTSLVRVRYQLTNPITTTTGGLRFAIRFVVTLNADNAWVAIGYAQLGYK